MALTTEQKDRAVELYLKGDGDRTAEEITTADIYQETGVSRPALYMILRQRGIQPRRQRGVIPPDVDVAAIMERNDALNREVGRLQLQLEQCEARCAELEAQLTTRTPPRRRAK